MWLGLEEIDTMSKFLSEFVSTSLDLIVFLIAFALISGLFPTIPFYAIILVAAAFSAFRTTIFNICKTQLYVTNFKRMNHE